MKFASYIVKGCESFMSSKNIEILVKNVQMGDVSSFGDLYELFSKDLYKFAFYYTGSEQAAEDCVSEAVLLAFQKITTLKNPQSVKSWMLKILRNCCYAYLNEKRKSIGNVEYSSALDIKEEERDINSEISLVNALKRLDEKEREIIVLHYSCGYTSKQIGKMLKMKDSSVRSRLSRSTAKLKEILSD